LVAKADDVLGKVAKLLNLYGCGKPLALGKCFHQMPPVKVHNPDDDWVYLAPFMPEIQVFVLGVVQ
jgi:hypothetical protein